MLEESAAMGTAVAGPGLGRRKEPTMVIVGYAEFGTASRVVRPAADGQR
jgi:hypothetical protein